ncbi:MAG: ribonuclease III [Nitrospinota bacterium]
MVVEPDLSPERAEQLSVFQRRLGYDFNDVQLLETALTHRSFANEGRRKRPHNERMEFLGDAVLDLVLSEQYFCELPDASEGQLSKLRSRLVSASHLAKMARVLEIGAYLRLGKGELSTGGRHKTSLLANAFEAVIGAIFLDAGYHSAAGFIRKLFDREMDPHLDFKSQLQEFIQRSKKSIPAYKVLREEGPEHQKVFEIGVGVDGVPLASGVGTSKKSAEQQAAKNGLVIIREEWEDASS